MNAAYSVWDDRTQLPARSTIAAAAPDPKVTAERRVIGHGPHVLSKTALSHWARWKVSGDYQRVHFRGGIAGQRDADALDQLERNLIDLGPRQSWFTFECRTSRRSMRPDLPKALMHGLVMDVRVLPVLLKLLDLRCEQEAMLEKALRAMERVETLNRPAIPVAAAPVINDQRTEGEDMSAMKERVRRALETRNLPLTEPVPEQAKREIATALGVHESTVNRNIVDMRFESLKAQQVTPPGGTLLDRLKAHIADRGIDLRETVSGEVKGELAELLGTTPATISSYLADLRSKLPARASERPTFERPTVTTSPVEALVEKPVPPSLVPPLLCSACNGDGESCDACGFIKSVETPPDATHELRAEIDTLRSQLAALTSDREALKSEMSCWQELAEENERQRQRWMNQALDLRCELEALKVERASSPLPVATVPDAIAQATVRELAGYEALGADVGRLVERKQREYGDATRKAGAILHLLYPDGIAPEQYADLHGIVRVADKLCRIANGNQGDESAWVDVAGYGLLGAARR